MSDTREYIVSLKRKEDLESLYQDMESNSSKKTIPNRQVKVASRRPISRNTHYWLTDDEAALLRKDPRVLAVELTPEEQGFKIEPLNWVQTSSNWSKSFTTQASDVNWGLLRCYNGVNTVGWGSSSDNTSIPTINGTVELTNIGRNVDVVIMDGIIPVNHPEYAVNRDGSGGSRVIRYNWWQHNPVVKGTAAGTYPYTSYETNPSFSGSNYHGIHVAGTAAGNTQGWARGANIYNLFAYDNDSSFFIDYVRAFHASKPINPLTGRKNPTIVNMSFTLTFPARMSSINSVNYRGQTYYKPSTGWTQAQRDMFGLIAVDMVNGGTLYIRSAAVDADMIDATNDGIIMVGAAGNNSMLNANPGDTDYNNSFSAVNAQGQTVTIFYHRGPSQGGAPTAICVSAVDIQAVKAGTGYSILEPKVNFSCVGPRTDIFAPGTMIMSAYGNEAYATPAVKDPRNGFYYLNKLSGTSMASPQVTGILACTLEASPNMRQSEALQWLIKHSQNGVMFDRPSNYTDFYSLQNAPNRYIRFKLGRPKSKAVYPRNNVNDFSDTKIVYPKPKIRRKG